MCAVLCGDQGPVDVGLFGGFERFLVTPNYPIEKIAQKQPE
jgi:hypothetical protein